MHIVCRHVDVIAVRGKALCSLVGRHDIYHGVSVFTHVRMLSLTASCVTGLTNFPILVALLVSCHLEYLPQERLLFRIVGMFLVVEESVQSIVRHRF